MTTKHDELVQKASEAIETDWGHSATVEDMAEAVITAIEPLILGLVTTAYDKGLDDALESEGVLPARQAPTTIEEKR